MIAELGLLWCFQCCDRVANAVPGSCRFLYQSGQNFSNATTEVGCDVEDINCTQGVRICFCAGASRYPETTNDSWLVAVHLDKRHSMPKPPFADKLLHIFGIARMGRAICCRGVARYAGFAMAGIHLKFRKSTKLLSQRWLVFPIRFSKRPIFFHRRFSLLVHNHPGHASVGGIFCHHAMSAIFFLVRLESFGIHSIGGKTLMNRKSSSDKPFLETE